MESEKKQPDRRESLWDRVWRPRRRNRTPDPSIVQVMAQWTEYELIFNDILTRLNAQLARHAKMEKKALERAARELGEAPAGMGNGNQLPLPPVSPKAALRSQYATGRYGSRIAALLASKEGQNVSEHQGE